MELTTKVELTGPLFRGVAPRILRQVTESAVKDLTEAGESFLLLRLRPRPAGVYKTAQQAGKDKSTGHYRRNIQSSVRNLTGELSDGGVIYGPWLEGVGSRNRSTRFKGYFSFRAAKQLVEKRVDRTINQYLGKFVRRMNT
jgi:hypothetical protein